MASGCIACRILIHNELLQRVDTFPYLGSLITIPYQVKQLAGDLGISAKIWKSHSIPISTKIRLIKVLVWPVVTYGCESWTLRKNEETCLDAFEMKGLRKILWVS